VCTYISQKLAVLFYVFHDDAHTLAIVLAEQARGGVVEGKKTKRSKSVGQEIGNADHIAEAEPKRLESFDVTQELHARWVNGKVGGSQAKT
jgi:hypothetical protein